MKKWYVDLHIHTLFAFLWSILWKWEMEYPVSSPFCNLFPKLTIYSTTPLNRPPWNTGSMVGWSVKIHFCLTQHELNLSAMGDAIFFNPTCIGTRALPCHKSRIVWEEYLKYYTYFITIMLWWYILVKICIYEIILNFLSSCSSITTTSPNPVSAYHKTNLAHTCHKINVKMV